MIAHIELIRDTGKYVSKNRRLFTQKDLDYIIDNHSKSTIKQMAATLSMSTSALKFYCYKYNIYPKREVLGRRPNKNEVNIAKEKVVRIIEDYVSTGDTIGNIAERNNSTVYTVNKCLSTLYFGKPLNESTEIITLQSKI